MKNRHIKRNQQKKRRKLREEYNTRCRAIKLNASIKKDKSALMKASDEVSKLLGRKHTRANYGDKLYDKEMEKGNKLTFIPKDSQ